MSRFACPVCHDPHAYPLWIDSEPPEGCPYDEAWQNGLGRAVLSVDQCAYQMRKARQMAEWRRLVPEAFDENGNIKAGMLAYVLERLPADRTLMI
jgi:hypothetical protein